MFVKNEVEGFSWLESNCWCGAIDTLNVISTEGKEDEFMDFLKEVFYNRSPTMTELNDFIWFEDEYIFEALRINNDDFWDDYDEEDEEEEEGENEDE